jgi:hypothetical protein
MSFHGHPFNEFDPAACLACQRGDSSDGFGLAVAATWVFVWSIMIGILFLRMM